MLVWWATEIEAASAISRMERAGDLGETPADRGLARLDKLAADWHEVEPGDSVRRIARRLVRTHPLRAADALQLAAAIVGAEGDPSSLPFVSIDDRLNDAARREGFPVTGPEAS